MTMVDNMKKHLSNQKGQAIFEMILFIPFIMFLYTIYYTAGNAISGSITQQTSVRGYFYISMKGNSFVNTSPELQILKSKGMKTIGFNSFGWADHLGSNGGSESYGTCYSFSSLLRNGSSDTCDGAEREKPGSSPFVRVFTFYGVCGPVYTTNSQDALGVNQAAQGAGRDACVVSSK
jgi:hypothetical protein